MNILVPTLHYNYKYQRTSAFFFVRHKLQEKRNKISEVILSSGSVPFEMWQVRYN